MKKVLILSNHHAYTYNFRKEIIQALINKNYQVYLVLPYGEKVELLKRMGCKFIDLPLDRRGMNPIRDLKLIKGYYKIISIIKPDVVLSYTIKPNIYGGIVCRLKKIPFLPNITGLGSATEKKSILQRLLINMYKFALKYASCVFFQNDENKDFFIKNNIPIRKHRVIPGSGVNINEFSLLPYPSDETIHFLYISRIMKEKGIDQYLEAASYIKEKYPNTVFHVLGFCEEKYYVDKLNEMQNQGVILYHGLQDDVKKYYKIAHCVIHPTYYPEGMSNVLLESAASGRPIITTNRSGCKEIVEDRVTGYLIEPKNTEDLINKIEEFLALKHEEKKQMGKLGRKKVEKEFNRKIVVNAYLEQISKILKEGIEAE